MGWPRWALPPTTAPRAGRGDAESPEHNRPQMRGVAAGRLELRVPITAPGAAKCSHTTLALRIFISPLCLHVLTPDLGDWELLRLLSSTVVATAAWPLARTAKAHGRGGAQGVCIGPRPHRARDMARKSALEVLYKVLKDKATPKTDDADQSVCVPPHRSPPQLRRAPNLTPRATAQDLD